LYFFGDPDFSGESDHPLPGKGFKENNFYLLCGTPVAFTPRQDNNSYLLSPEKG
jgi:hypothetical protein